MVDLNWPASVWVADPEGGYALNPGDCSHPSVAMFPAFGQLTADFTCLACGSIAVFSWKDLIGMGTAEFERLRRAVNQ